MDRRKLASLSLLYTGSGPSATDVLYVYGVSVKFASRHWHARQATYRGATSTGKGILKPYQARIYLDRGKRHGSRQKLETVSISPLHALVSQYFGDDNANDDISGAIGASICFVRRSNTDWVFFWIRWFFPLISRLFPLPECYSVILIPCIQATTPTLQPAFHHSDCLCCLAVTSLFLHWIISF